MCANWWSLMCSRTTVGVAISPIRVVTDGLLAWTTSISCNAFGIFASGSATRRIEGVLDVCGLGLRAWMSAESVGVYEGIYRSEKYRSTLPSDRIGPIAWRGREQKTDVGHHQMRDCSGTFNVRSLSITGLPTRS